MIKDINTVKSQLIEADICIVGTGAAGIAIALELESAGKKIVMLEAGSAHKTEIDQSFYELDNAKLAVDINSRRRVFGGTTTAWEGGWKPLDPIDLENREWVPFSGWPLEWGKLAPYYDRAAQLFGGPRLEGFNPGGISGLLNTDDIKTTLLRRLPPYKWDFAKNYGSILDNSQAIEVLLNAPVTKLMLDGGDKKISEALVQTLLGNKFRVKADSYVIACGGIENARLLIFSGVGNRYDQVGRYYMDHPKFVSGEIIPGKTAIAPLYLEPQDIDGSAVAGFQLSEKAQNNAKTLNSYVRLLPIYGTDGSHSLWSRASRALSRIRGRASKIRIRNFMEQEPSPANRISLSQKTDMFGNPLARVEWSISDLEKKSIFLLHEALKRELEKGGMGLLTGPLLDGREDLAHVRDASHHMGTTRMGADPRTSVVDADCKVHEAENLFIAGSSVFTTSGHANPTATIIALAIRLADHLRGPIESSYAFQKERSLPKSPSKLSMSSR